jgi:hypothetical protein
MVPGKPPALKQRSGQSKKQTAIEDAPPPKQEEWELEELFTFGSGPLENQWLTKDQVQTRSTAQRRMRSLGSVSSYGPLDYAPTAKQVPHPVKPWILGTLCVMLPESKWHRRIQPAPDDKK